MTFEQILAEFEAAVRFLADQERARDEYDFGGDDPEVDGSSAWWDAHLAREQARVDALRQAVVAAR